MTIKRVGIVGSGTMGSGIAEVAAKNGYEVILRSRSQGGADGMVASSSVGPSSLFVVQTWAQAHLAPTRAAVIMTMEPVFAGLFAVAVAGERFGPRAATGALLVLVAMVLTEVGPRRGAEGEVERLEL